jgi:polysaccharide biosynthesis protein PslH
MNDGGNLAMKAMIDGYHYNGWEVHLLAMNTTRHFVDHATLKGLYTHIASFQWVDIDNSVTKVGVVKNYLFSKEAEHVGRFYQPDFEQQLVAAVQHINPDVVQMESVYLTTYLPAIKKVCNAVLILRCHNIEYHIWHGLAEQTKNPIKKRYFLELTKRLKEFELKAWKAYDILLAITHKDAFHIGRYHKLKHLVVAPFGMDSSCIAPDEQASMQAGYHIGAMDWIPNRKGIEWFITQAWPRVQTYAPGFEFHFAGRKMPDSLTQNLPEHVHCAGEVRDASDFIADKKILIVPVTTAGGIRIKIMEGMVRAKVVISTPEGVKGLEAKANQHYLPARTEEEFAKAIQWCVKNPALAAKVAEEGRNLMLTKYDQNSITKNMLHEIDEVLEERL